LKMEDYLNFLKMQDGLIVINWRWHQFFLEKKNNLNILRIEGDLKKQKQKNTAHTSKQLD
jgi:hypothetical protein